MKKQSIALAASLIVASGLSGASLSQTNNTLSYAASTFGMQTFNKNLSVAQQNASLTEWEQAFAQAKTFVIDNSKNLVGTKDPVLLEVMSNIEKINTDLINAIKVIRGTLPNAPISQLLGIATNAKNSTQKLYTAKFTLNNKKEASSILINIARFIEEIAKRLYNDLLLTPQSTPSTRSLSTTSTQSIPTPPTRSLSTNKEEIHECCICYEDVPSIKIPCKNQHPEFICKSCLASLKKCPMCNGELLK
jgi:hypothetical protein